MQILRNVILALGKKSRIVITVAGRLTPLCRSIMDIGMMLNFNAVERDLEGWNDLFASADKMLKLQQISTPPCSA